MATIDQRRELEPSLERIEEMILPRLSLMLDSLLDAAVLARAGLDAEIQAAELRAIGRELDSLTRQIQSLVPCRKADDVLPMSSPASSFRMSA